MKSLRGSVIASFLDLAEKPRTALEGDADCVREWTAAPEQRFAYSEACCG